MSVLLSCSCTVTTCHIGCPVGIPPLSFYAVGLATIFCHWSSVATRSIAVHDDRAYCDSSVYSKKVVFFIARLQFKLSYLASPCTGRRQLSRENPKRLVRQVEKGKLCEQFSFSFYYFLWFWLWNVLIVLVHVFKGVVMVNWSGLDCFGSQLRHVMIALLFLRGGHVPSHFISFFAPCCSFYPICMTFVPSLIISVIFNSPESTNFLIFLCKVTLSRILQLAHIRVFVHHYAAILLFLDLTAVLTCQTLSEHLVAVCYFFLHPACTFPSPPFYGFKEKCLFSF